MSSLAVTFLAVWIAAAASSGSSDRARRRVAGAIGAYIDPSLARLEGIPEERKRQLEKLAQYVQGRRAAGLPARLMFVCTHNSRRSHMAQIWAQTAAAFYAVDGIETYSGGTEATAFHPRAVAALERAGFRIETLDDGDNPSYEVRYHPAGPPMQAFSKVYTEKPNPSTDFCAILTCSQADRTCPAVQGAALRVSLPYEDPKTFDGTDREASAYDDRCRQIGREMLYLFSRVRAR